MSVRPVYRDVARFKCRSIYGFYGSELAYFYEHNANNGYGEKYMHPVAFDYLMSMNIECFTSMRVGR